jgi:hypothetical protein
MARPSLPVFVLNISGRTRETVSAVLFFLVILLVVYLPSFSGVWVYDDFPNIVANENVHPKVLDFSSLIQSFYWTSENPDASEKIQRPLAYLSFAVNWYVGEDRVFGYHVVNFIIHLTSACFLYLFIRSTLVLPTLGKPLFEQCALDCFPVSADLGDASDSGDCGHLYRSAHGLDGRHVYHHLPVLLFKGKDFRFNPTEGRMLHCFRCRRIVRVRNQRKQRHLAHNHLFIRGPAGSRGLERFNFKKMIVWGLAAGALVAVIGLFYVDPMTILNGFDNRPYTPIERVLTESRVILTYLRLLFYPLLSEFTLVHDVVVSTSLWAPWTTLASILTLVGLILFSLLWLAKRQAIIAFAILFFLF